MVKSYLHRYKEGSQGHFNSPRLFPFYPCHHVLPFLKVHQYNKEVFSSPSIGEPEKNTAEVWGPTAFNLVFPHLKLEADSSFLGQIAEVDPYLISKRG